MKYLVVLFIFFINTLCSQNELDTFLNKENLKTAHIGLSVYNISNKKIVQNYQNEKLFYPASLQKLVTTTAALNILGSDFRYRTNINLNGTVEDKTFKGILEIIASGDPTINAKFIDFVYDFLIENNIQKIEGYITVNQEKFSLNAEKSWLIEDVANYYGSPAFGFNFLENTYRLTFAQKEENKTPKILSTSPYMRNLKFDNQLVSKGKRDNAYIIGLPFSNERKIVGSIPPGKGTFTIKGAIDNPAQIFKNMLIKKFQKENFAFVFNGSVDSKLLFKSKDYISQSLDEIISVTNKNSNNLYAEALLKTIGLKKYGFASSENGLKALKETFPKISSLYYDGSGLSRKNVSNANAFLELLKREYSNKTFRNSLGISGISGTMKYFSSDKMKGKIEGKSGSADGILNYAGYFKNNKGELMAFVFLVNNYSGSKSQVRREMIKVLEAYL